MIIPAAVRNAAAFVGALVGTDNPHDASEALTGSQAPIPPTPKPVRPARTPADTAWWESQADRIAERLAR